VGDRDGTPGPKPGQGRAHGQPYYDHAPAARWEIGTAPPAPNPPSAERTASPTPPITFFVAPQWGSRPLELA